MTGVIAALAGSGGAVDYTGSATVTVGYYNLSGTGFNIDYWGFSETVPFGSVTPSSWSSSGLSFRILDYLNDNAGTALVVFAVNGYAPNSGWTTLTIAGTPYTRSSASYAYNSGDNFTQWIWTAPSNPYGTTVGATKALSWT